MKHKSIQHFSAFLFTFLLANISFSQLQVTANGNGQQLVNALLGQGVQVSNVVVNCPQGASGTFNGSLTNLGLTSGILLTNGSVGNAQGPNNTGSAGLANGGSTRDPDLDAIIAPDSTFDVCVLEFDIIPTCDTLSVRYVFGSEEYDEYVCGDVNDVFGFFISGPGYPTLTNIALIPGTTTPVMINTVNIGNVGSSVFTPAANCDTTNFGYYNSNVGVGTTIQYDGFTVPMEAKAAVTPCLQYHIKIAIADGGDDVWDSGVFLENGGFTCGGTSFSVASNLSSVGASVAVEGCVNAELIFNRLGDSTRSDSVTVTLGGTATNGTDYNGAPTKVVFPPGVISDTFQLNIFDDLISEGPETLLVIINDSTCNGSSDDTTIIIIGDPPVADVGSVNPLIFCAGDTLPIGALPDAGATYSWNPGTGLSSNTAADPTLTLTTAGNSTYVITETDSNGCDATDTLQVTVNAIPTASLTATGPVCEGINSTVQFNGTAGSGATYTWNFDGGNSSGSSGPGPFTVNWSTSGSKSVSVIVSENGCTDGPATVTVDVGSDPILTPAPQNVTCNGNANGVAAIVITGGNAPFSYTWNNGASTPSLNGVGPGNYTVTVNDSFGCSASTTVNINEPTVLTATFNTNPSSCLSTNPTGIATVFPSGGTPPYTFIWNNGQTTATASNLTAGTYTVTVTDANNCTFQGNVTVAQIPSPTVTAGPDVSFCEGEGGTMINATASGGTPGYSYVWTCDTSNTWCGLDSVFDNDPNANPDTTTTYYIQVFDVNGCPSNLDSLVVTVLPKPKVNAGPDLYICADSAPCQIIQASVSAAPGPYRYQWLPSDGLSNDTILNPCARPDTTTIYTLVVHSLGNGCTSDVTTTDTLSSVTVHVQPLPIAIAHVPADRVDICFGDTVQLQGLPNGAGPNYQAQWSPASGLSATNTFSPFAFPTQTTDYILTAWSNGCPSYGDTVTVVVHTQPTADAGPDRQPCLGDTTQLDGEGSGDITSTGYSYNWTPSSGFISATSAEDPFVSPPATTTYYLTATSSWGCVSLADSVTVHLRPTPVADAGSDIVLCDGKEGLLNGGYYYSTTDSVQDPSQIFYTWTPPAFLDNPGIEDPTTSTPQSMYYYLRVTYQDCETEDSVLVTVLPELPLTAWADTSTICGEDSVGLNAIGGWNNPAFQWIPGTGVSNPMAGQTMASPSDSITYMVIITEGGCKDTAEVVVNVIPKPKASYLSSNPEGCVEFTVNFLENSEDAHAWVWNFGDGSPVSNEQNPVHVYTAPGNYVVSLTAVGQGNCQTEVSTITISVEEPPLVDFGSTPGYPAQLTLPNTEVEFEDQSKNSLTWFWDFGDGETSIVRDPVHRFIEPGEYYVTEMVTNEIGCMAEVSHGPYIVTAPDLFIPNIFSPNDDGNNDVFRVEYSGDQPFDLQIRDRWGVLHYQSSNKVNGWDGKTAGGKALPTGVYFYQVTVGEKDYVGELTLVR